METGWVCYQSKIKEGVNSMKIIKIEDCIDCPFNESDDINLSWLCVYSNKSKLIAHYTELGDIPEWCPLEDYKDENSNN